ncbi:MAG: uroporphyrinogen decarboxylase family protein [bacterium]
MTGRERILTAIDRRQPDAVPVWELAFNEPSIVALARGFADESQLPEPKFYGDMSDLELLQLVEAFAAMVRGLDIDGVCAPVNAQIERLDQKHVRDEMGVVYHVSDFGEPYPVAGPLKDPADVRGFRMPPVRDSDFLLIDMARSRFPDRAVSYMMLGPFALSWGLRGSLERLMMDYVENPALVRDMARLTTDYCLESLEKIAAKGADFIVEASDVAFISAPMISVSQFDEFLAVYFTEIVSRAHELGMKVVKHSDGVLTPLIPSLIKCGFDGIHPVQPQCMDIGETKRIFGDRLCIVGNIDCAYLLVSGAPEDVRAAVRDTIAAAAPGGGYIISSSNTIHPGVKPENYVALVKAAREFGRYASLPATGA